MSTATYGGKQYGKATPPYGRDPSPLFALTGISPSSVEQIAGQLITITGTFDRLVAYAVYLGGVQLYGGRPGEGKMCRSPDGVTLQAVAPPFANGSSEAQTLTVDAGTRIATLPMTLVESPFRGVVHSLRRSFPPWACSTPRRLDLEERRWLTTP